jgi:hypothetical protein
MTSTSTSTSALRQITNAPEGIVRVFCPDGSTHGTKRELRDFAAKIAGTINVGATPTGKRTTVTLPDGTKLAGHAFDFAPVARTGGTVQRAAEPSEPVDPRIGALVAALGVSEAQAVAMLAVAGPAPKTAPAKGKSGKSAKSSEWAAAHLGKWNGVTCKACRDFGKVRGPSAGAAAGHPFRTQRGADTSPTAIPCPAHKTGRKGKTA